MEQIKHNQILPVEKKSPNPITGFPRDFALQNEFVLREDPLSLIVNPIESSSPSVNEDPAPLTPVILGIKEQIVIFNADGTAKIDLILEIEDVESAVEYDVRVTKRAGSL